MKSHLKKLCLLTWKNFKVIQRHWLMTTFEILIPVLLFSLIAWLNTNLPADPKESNKPISYFNRSDENRIKSDFPRDTALLYYSPQNNFTNDVMNEVKKTLNFNRISPVGSEQEFSNSFLVNYESISVSYMKVIGVFFKNQEIRPKHLHYTIRTESLEWRTKLIFPIEQPSGPMDNSELYIRTGFLSLQYAIDRAFIDLLKPNNNLNLDYGIQEFPYPAYKEDNSGAILSASLLANCVVFGFLVLCLNIVGQIVEDKQTGITELLKLMGLSRWMLWLSWFIRVIFINMLTVTIIVFLMKFTFNKISGPVFPSSSSTLIWGFLLITTISVTVFMFAISTLFYKPVLAMCCSTVIWLLSYFISTILIDIYKPTCIFIKLITCLLPNVAMYWGFTIVEVLETKHTGVLWSNLYRSNELRMGHVLFMLIFDIFLYGFITWYIDSIFPGDYGVPRPWNFLFKKSY